MKNLFISHSSKDRDWVVRLRTVLAPLLKSGRLSMWDVSQVRVGDGIDDEVKERLDQAEGILLLVSADYLASDYLADVELPMLLNWAAQHGVPLFWIPIGPALYDHSPLYSYEPICDPRRPLNLLSPDKQNEALVQIAEKLIDISDKIEQSKKPMEFVPARVAAITLEDVKCFRNTTIEFAEDANPCLIIGSNARGKSTILQALVLGLKEISRVPFTQAWRDVVKNGAREGRVTITVTAGEKTATLDYRIYNGNLTHIMNLDPSWLALRNRFIVLGYGASRHVRLEDPKPEPEIESVATLFGENGYLKHVKNSLTHSRVVEHFQPIKDLTNRILESGGHPIELEAYSVENGFGFRTPTNPGKLLPLEALSEGYKSTFVWMLDMMVRLLELGVDLKRPEKVTGVVLLDEIDLHLHPSWQRTLLPGIVKVFPGVQFIATTHSPFVVQSVESKGVTVLHVEDDTVTAETVDGVDRALSYESVVEELFGVTSLFSHDVELALVRFQELKNLVATGETAEEEPLRKEALKLAQMGVEVEGIVRRELMDLKRVTGKDLWKK